MTTTQTIDGVPRELIEKAMLACFEAGHGITHDRLRALLAHPAVPSKFVGAAQYWGENEQALRDVCRFEGLKGLVYQVVRDLDKPAAQPRGEPVAYRYKELQQAWESEKPWELATVSLGRVYLERKELAERGVLVGKERETYLGLTIEPLYA